MKERKVLVMLEVMTDVKMQLLRSKDAWTLKSWVSSSSSTTFHVLQAQANSVRPTRTAKQIVKRGKGRGHGK